jgi:hypothetical protein
MSYRQHVTAAMTQNPQESSQKEEGFLAIGQRRESQPRQRTVAPAADDPPPGAHQQILFICDLGPMDGFAIQHSAASLWLTSIIASKSQLQ